LLLSAVPAGDIDRQWLAPDAKQQQRRSTALSSKCGQWHVGIRVDEAEQTHTHAFNGPLSGTTRVSRYQKGKTNMDFTETKKR